MEDPNTGTMVGGALSADPDRCGTRLKLSEDGNFADPELEKKQNKTNSSNIAKPMDNITNPIRNFLSVKILSEPKFLLL